MIRAVIYARFSTELQNAKSTEDQIALCRAFAKREGMTEVGQFFDNAKSGASFHGRTGFHDMLDMVMAGSVDAIVVEQLDRLSRDMADMAGLYKRLTFMGVKIVEVHGGEANTMMVGMRSLFAQMFREDNVHKVRRGMAGLISKGLTAGGKAYGYKPDPLNAGRPSIVEAEAHVVQRIYHDYNKGVSPKTICRALNQEGVKAPRGDRWGPSALLGMAARGTGILRNELYAGRCVWGKVTMVRNPDTGKRLSRPVPPEDWKRADVPDLRILPEGLFDAVQAQLNARSNQRAAAPLNASHRPKRLLSGLLKCGACGTGMAVAGVDKSGRTRLRCSAHTNSGTCPNPKTFYLNEVEELVIDSLTKELAHPDQIRRYAETYMRERIAKAEHEGRRRGDIEARLTAIARESAKLVDLMLVDGADTETLGAKSKGLVRERDQLRTELAALPETSNVVVLPSAVKAFADKLAAVRPKLHMTLLMLDDLGELQGLVREIVQSITLYRDEPGTITIKVDSYLAPFMAEPKAHNSLGAAMLVAEEGS